MMFTQLDMTKFAYFAGGIQEIDENTDCLKIPRNEILERLHLDINHHYDIVGMIKFSKKFQDNGLFVMRLCSQEHPTNTYYVMAWLDPTTGGWRASLGTIFSYELFTGMERD